MTRTAQAAVAVVAAVLLAVTGSGCSNGSSSKATSTPSTTTATATATATATVTATASASATATAAGATVAVGSGGKLGSILVDDKGRTLYLFEADTSTKSTCSGSCAVAWPPLLTSGAPKAGTGAKADLLGTTARSKGATEVTYNGHPLYYYAGDTTAGDTTGEELNQFGAKWYVLNAAGDKVEGD